jgi:hypothetical protein
LDIPKFTGQCSVSGRGLKPGEVFFSVLAEKNSKFERLDFAAENWVEPEQCFAWWKTAVPQNVQKTDKPLPNVILLELFEELLFKQNTAEEQPDTLYVLTLLLIRRRILRLEKEYNDDSGQKIISVSNPKESSRNSGKDGSKDSSKDIGVFDIPAVMPDTEPLDKIQKRLAELLYADELKTDE